MSDSNQPARQRQWAMRHFILSSCWGAIPIVMVRDSSIVILFADYLRSGEIIPILTTSLQDICSCLLLLPFAWLSDYFGYKRTILASCWIAMVMLLITAMAPWFGPWSRVVLMASLVVFAVATSSCTAAIFPFLDGLILEGERGLFFGRMRFSWQFVATVFLLAAGWLVGRQASMGTLQGIIIVAALMMLGRIWHMRVIPDVAARKTLLGARDRLRDVLANRPLLGFAIYLFSLYTAAGATIPIAFVFAKTELALPDYQVVLMSVCAMSGSILGYLAGGIFVHRYGVKRVFLSAHLLFGIINLLLLTVTGAGLPVVIWLMSLVGIYGFLTAGASVAVSSEILAVAPFNNKAVSIAFCLSLYFGGAGCSRLLASLILGSGMLSPHWGILGITLTKYHALFLFYGAGVIAASLLLVLVPALMKNVQRLPE